MNLDNLKDGKTEDIKENDDQHSNEDDSLGLEHRSLKDDDEDSPIY